MHAHFQAWLAIATLVSWLSVPAAAAGRLINLSSRALAGHGADTLAAGFVISGTAPMRVLLRGAGPALAALGVEGALPAVRLELFRGGVSLGTNLRWDAGAEAAAIAEAGRRAGAFALAPGSADAALLVTLAPGGYTAHVTPAAAAAPPGVALVEVYDVDAPPGAQLVNLSTRARAAAATLIAGYVYAGDGGSRVLVRAAGPALGAFGVTGALADPRLEVFHNGASVAYNDDWQGNPNPAQLGFVARHSGAFEFAPGSRDAALLLPRAAGACTAQVVEAPAEGGVALVEIYDTAAVRGLPPPRVFDLAGFARVAGHGLAGFTGGGTPTVPYDPVARTGNFWVIDEGTTVAAGFAGQLQAALGSDQPLVVEINTMIDLARFGRPNNSAPALAHPDLFAAGRTTGTVGTLNLGSNKTIYSAYGNGGFRRGTLFVDGQRNIALRNLKFRELWEWDDATQGAYDRNGWDYVVLQSTAGPGTSVAARAHHLWIDHCDFEKSYDGTVDIVRGVDLVTVSWTKFGGVVSGESVRWLRRQLDHLEANRSRYPYYNFLRARRSVDGIFARERFQQKSNLVGNSTDAITRAYDLGHLNVTFHHNWYLHVDQRMPRMRFGNAHVFNLLAESTAGLGIVDLTLAGVAATSGAAVRLENSVFIDVRLPVNPQIGVEPPGYITVLGSANLDGATRRDRGFDPVRTVPLAEFRWNLPAAETGLGAWPLPDSAVMPAGYVRAGATLGEYLDDRDALEANLAQVGILVPADEAEAELLRARWQAPTAPR